MKRTILLLSISLSLMTATAQESDKQLSSQPWHFRHADNPTTSPNQLNAFWRDGNASSKKIVLCVDIQPLGADSGQPSVTLTFNPDSTCSLIETKIVTLSINKREKWINETHGKWQVQGNEILIRITKKTHTAIRGIKTESPVDKTFRLTYRIKDDKLYLKHWRKRWFF